MEDLKYKEISKIVGIDNKILLRVSLEIQTNHIKMKAFKITPYRIEDFVKKMNKIDFYDKLVVLRKDYVEKFNYAEDTMRRVYMEYITDQYAVFEKESEFKEIQENFSNLDNYTGTSMPIVKWLSTFSNEVLDMSIMEFVPSIVSKIESIPLDKIEPINYTDEHDNINEYVVYMGNMKKYRGAIGYIEKIRDDDDATTLVCFPGKGKDKSGIGKLWCSNDNLLAII